tara:strand:+ start:334 stop:975 length:642 start_codon:yes stop_codon:yes gene_type:complete
MIEVFPTDVHKFKVPNYKSLNKKLITKIYGLKKHTDKPYNMSNSGGWHSEYFDSNDYSRKSYYLNQLSEIIGKFFSDEILKLDMRVNPDTLWANINNKNSFNKTHTHGSSYYSGVYYVKVPKNSGNLFLINPYYWNTKKIRPSYHTKYRFESKYLEIEFPAVEGDLYFFNGCVPHRVGKNLTSDDRISVSFNFGYDRIHEKLYGYEKLPWENK